MRMTQLTEMPQTNLSMNKDVYRVYVLEDESLLRQLVIAYVESIGGIEMIGSSGDGAVAMKEIVAKEPDLVFADIRVPEVSGLEALYLIKRRLPNTKVILFSGSITSDNIRIAYDGQVDAFIEKGEGLSEFQEAIEAVRSGKRYYSEHVRRVLLALEGERALNDMYTKQDQKGG